MAQKVQFIVTVLHRPELLIFDEPFSGFDPINANILKREILRLRDEGATVIFSTHNMASVEELCDSITLINSSRNILTGNVRDLRQQFSDNTYEFSFLGDECKLADAVTPMVRALDMQGLDRDGFQTVSLRLDEAGDLRDVISAINSAVDLKAFKQQLPTMNDIFIRTVETFNQSQQQ